MWSPHGLRARLLPGNDKWFHRQSFPHSPAPSIQTCRLQIVRKKCLVWNNSSASTGLTNHILFYPPPLAQFKKKKKKKGGKGKWPGILMIDFHKTVHVACWDKKKVYPKYKTSVVPKIFVFNIEIFVFYVDFFRSCILTVVFILRFFILKTSFSFSPTPHEDINPFVKLQVPRYTQAHKSVSVRFFF